MPFYNVVAIVTRVCNIAAEAIVLLATWHATYRIKREATIGHIKVPVSTLLVQDGQPPSAGNLTAIADYCISYR